MAEFIFWLVLAGLNYLSYMMNNERGFLFLKTLSLIALIISIIKLISILILKV